MAQTSPFNLSEETPLLPVTLLVTIMGTTAVLAQTETPINNAKTVLDPSPWPSARGAAMGGALAGLADGADAPYLNPAAIGGLHVRHHHPQTIRLLHFPFLGAAMNENSINLNEDINQIGGLSDQALVDRVLDAYEGKRQYGRFSFVPSLTFSRISLAYIQDMQLAAVKQSTTAIDTHYRSTNGPSLGFSITDPDGWFYFGAWGAWLQRKETKGDFQFEQLNDPERRKATIKENSHRYSGFSGSVGMIWRMSDLSLPTLSLVAREVGQTTYTSDDASTSPTVVEPQNLITAFSISPSIGKQMFYNATIEAFNLLDKDLAIEQKLRVGMELTYGEKYGVRAPMSIRYGYNIAGSSFGIGLNLGLVNLQASIFSQDIGMGNSRFIERRGVINFSLDVGEH